MIGRTLIRAIEDGVLVLTRNARWRWARKCNLHKERNENPATSVVAKPLEAFQRTMRRQA